MTPDRPSALLCSSPINGHVTPLLVLARHLTASGVDVRVITGSRFRPAVEATGARFVPLPDESDFDDRDLNERFPERRGLKGMAQLRFDISNVFIAPARGQMRALDAAIAEQRPDVVIADTTFLAAPMLVLRSGDRPTVIALSSVPYGAPSRDTAPYGFGLRPRADRLGRMRNALLNALVDRVLLSRIQPEADALYRDLTGRPMPGRLFDHALHADLFLQSTVPSFEYPRSDLPPTVRFLGPVVGAGTDVRSPKALPSWWGDLEGRRVVHVTQGTLANRDLTELVAPALRALADDDVLVVVATGGRSEEEVRQAFGGPLPANARIAEYLPYAELLPRTAVMVSNGGYGGVHFALRHGVPVVVAGLTEDKAEVGARVRWSGAGIALRTQRPKPAALRRAVRKVLAEPAFGRASSRIGRDIAATNPLETVRDLVLEAAAHRYDRAA